MASKTDGLAIVQKVPSFSPDSPQPVSVDQPRSKDDLKHADAAINYVLPQSIEPAEDTAALSDAELLSEGRGSPKRKRPAYDAEIPSSSPLRPMVDRTNKRFRSDQSTTKRREVPSTPEKDPAVDDQEQVMLGETTIVDLGGDCSASEDENEDKDIDGDKEENEDIVGHQASQSLSEPDHQWMSAKSIIEDCEGEHDFDLPPPEGGWASDGSEYDIHEVNHSALQGPEEAIEDTQALLNGKMPMLDLTVPDPDEDWSSVIHPPSSPPPLPASILSQDKFKDDSATEDAEVEVLDEEEANMELQKWAEERIAAGVPLQHIEIALRSTSNNLDLAEVVLESLARHAGVPQSMMGVWTEEDDADVVAVDARKIARLHHKHGEDAFDRRFNFLEIYNERA